MLIKIKTDNHGKKRKKVEVKELSSIDKKIAKLEAKIKLLKSKK